ncbi:MAG: hypothetical protein JNK79_19510 [Chitinophagaceae bacterium]|nr:hypothetical protein [Chitinophagaceae bacterium]
MKNFVLLFSLALLFVSCQKEGDLTLPDENNNNNNNNNNETDDDDDNTTSTYYFTAKIDGKDVEYVNDSPFFGAGVNTKENSMGWEDFDVYEGTIISDKFSLDSSVIYVHLLKYFNHDPTVEERWSIFTMGDHDWGLSQSSSATINGASIDYTDDHGKWWTSELGSQNGSTFTITELIENDEHLYGMIFTANFSCKLYDEEGNFIEVKNATIRGPIYGM